MRPQTESLELIARYLNSPSDLDLQSQVTAFRAASPENEAYFLEIEEVWQQSAEAGRLERTNVAQSVQQLKSKLAPVSVPKAGIITWFRGVAAAVVLLVAGFWLYRSTTPPNLIVKTTAKNQIDSVKLNDGSVVILAENSTLQYAENFGTEKREIQLDKGQAFFKITKDPAHPFKVVLHQSDVVVLGTSFNIKLSNKAIELGVKTGRVVFTPYKDGATSILTAGQALTYDVEKRELVSKTSQNLDSWLTKELTFVDTPLEEVCKQLTSYYGVDIKLQKNSNKAKKLNARFANQSLEEVLMILNETYNIKIKKENNQINLITP
ncbi:MAG: FecR domain-containing protein [Pedobacter sp.]|nr:FecR domain-containing protein [Pedobacter sp.]MDQ8053025.1 FecR domain-containing protein [Pedobacter sp.]